MAALVAFELVVTDVPAQQKLSWHKTPAARIQVTLAASPEQVEQDVAA